VSIWAQHCAQPLEFPNIQQRSQREVQHDP
jgi:hypothetical protein